MQILRKPTPTSILLPFPPHLSVNRQGKGTLQTLTISILEKVNQEGQFGKNSPQWNGENTNVLKMFKLTSSKIFMTEYCIHKKTRTWYTKYDLYLQCILFSHKKDWNFQIGCNMDGAWKQAKWNCQTQILYDYTYMRYLELASLYIEKVERRLPGELEEREKGKLFNGYRVFIGNHAKNLHIGRDND